MFASQLQACSSGEDLIGMIGPLWGEKDEAKRIDGWKAVDKYIAENALVIPLLQYVQPILSAPGVVVTPHASGALLRDALAKVMANADGVDETRLAQELALIAHRTSLPLPAATRRALQPRLTRRAATLLGVAP